MRTLSIVASVLLVLPSAAVAQNNKAGSARDEVKQVLVDYGNAITAGDAEKAIDLYLDSPEFFIFSDGFSANYRQTVENARKLISPASKYHMTWDTLDTHMLTPNTAAVYARFHQWYTVDGKEYGKEGEVSWIMVREKGRWKLAYGHASHRAIANNAETIEAAKAVVRAHEVAAAAGDLDAVMRNTPVDVVALSAGAAPVQGVAAFRELYRALLAQGRWKFTHHYQGADIVGDAVVFYGTAPGTLTTVAGTVNSFENNFLLILRRDSTGQFKIWRGAFAPTGKPFSFSFGR